jgi:hypothetical protein
MRDLSPDLTDLSLDRTKMRDASSFGEDTHTISSSGASSEPARPDAGILLTPFNFAGSGLHSA